MSGKRCTWTEGEDGVWDTQCGHRFGFNDGGPTANGFKNCPYCGKKMREDRFWGPDGMGTAMSDMAVI